MTIRLDSCCSLSNEEKRTSGGTMVPLYAARLEDLGPAISSRSVVRRAHIGHRSCQRSCRTRDKVLDLKARSRKLTHRPEGAIDNLK
jgi:hypothetical protein